MWGCRTSHIRRLLDQLPMRVVNWLTVCFFIGRIMWNVECDRPNWLWIALCGCGVIKRAKAIHNWLGESNWQSAISPRPAKWGLQNFLIASLLGGRGNGVVRINIVCPWLKIGINNLHLMWVQRIGFIKIPPINQSEILSVVKDFKKLGFLWNEK